MVAGWVDAGTLTTGAVVVGGDVVVVVAGGVDDDVVVEAGFCVVGVTVVAVEPVVDFAVVVVTDLAGWWSASSWSS